MIGCDKGYVESVTTAERSGDLGIAANGIAVARKISAESGDHFVHDPQIRSYISSRGVEFIRQSRTLNRQRSGLGAGGRLRKASGDRSESGR